MNQEKILSTLYWQTIRKFDDRWPIGGYDRLDNKKSPVLAQIDRAENDLNTVWNEVKQGHKSVIDFRKALQRWEIAHLKALNALVR